MSVAIKAENISKAYKLGEIGTGTLSNDLERWFAKIRGKEDPFLKIGETNDRSIKGTSDVVWSLKDISFEINRGDAVGIIGRNGAGKSTLLKILSQVTAPTTGSITGRGRIASLLEVGTGFHPELTGKENIFLNGAILGMRKKEIKRKFDEIVDFSGVERYIDTPVKRYSSGMYVRLAFAVAAHLESEILIVDEVLAVGDAEFQSKCIGKMNDVSKGEGRTVLFVSHNMASIKTLCQKGVYLKNGRTIFTGDINKAIEVYQSSMSGEISTNTHFIAPQVREKDCQILEVKITDERDVLKSEFDVWEKVYVHIKFNIAKENLLFVTPILNLEKDGIELLWSFASDNDNSILKGWEQGRFSYRVALPNPLKKGKYSVTIRLGKLRVGDLDIISNAVNFTVDEFSFDPTLKSYAASRGGIIAANLEWEKLK